jgi:LPS sulfotransferase NodH
VDHLFGDGRAVRAYEASVNRPAPTMLKTSGVTLSEYLNCLGIGLNTLFTNRSKGKRWIDKTPRHTLIVDLLAEMFPAAYFIHMLRDGRRVVNSMVNFHNAPSREAQRQQFGPLKQWDFRNACETWSRYVETALDFAARQPARCLTVRNEELIAGPLEGFRKIFDFIRAADESAPAEYFATHQINSSFWPGGRIDSPLPSRFSDPWENWTADQQHIFNERAGQTLARSGYVRPAGDISISTSAAQSQAATATGDDGLGSANLDNRTFILLSVARSGSNLLRDYLNQHDSISCFGEVFKKPFLKEKDWQFFASMDANMERLHTEDLVSFWKVVLRNTNRDRPVIGAKLFYYHREGDEIWKYLAASRTPIIHLIREELIDSYLSLKLAEASGVWTQPKNQAQEAAYERPMSIDLADFEKYCVRTQRWIRQARDLFKENPFLEISYSALINDRDKVMAAVYSFLDLPEQPTSARLARQRSHNREELIVNWQEAAQFIDNNPELCLVR